MLQVIQVGTFYFIFPVNLLAMDIEYFVLLVHFLKITTYVSIRGVLLSSNLND